MIRRLFALAAWVVPRRQWRFPSDAVFRVGHLWAWCPAEERQTPHHLDAGSRRCRSCKTTTRTEATNGG